MIKRLLPERLKLLLSKILRKILLHYLIQGLRDQGLLEIYQKLKYIVPDIKNQYTSFVVDDEYHETTMRAQHAFQILMINEVISLINKKLIKLVDIGDSSGTHIFYVKGLHPESTIKTLSINMDNKAIERIRNKGLEALQIDVKDIAAININTDIILCLETLEHFENPIGFLKDLSQKICRYLVITVPYLRESRVGFNYLRYNLEKYNPETNHVFELSPEDWRLIFRYSGWEIENEYIYWQYTKNSLFAILLRNHWRKYDFEGFYGVVLKQHGQVSM